MFTRRFPSKKLTIYRLRKVYRDHSIRRKKIKNSKVITDAQRKKIHKEAELARDKVAELQGLGYRILFVDEIVTTKSTIPTHEYSALKEPFTIDYKQYQHECVATVAAVSSEGGVDHVMSFPQSIDTSKFCIFLRQLRRKTKNEKVAIFMDRLNVHRSLRVQQLMASLGMESILNASYSPDFNPIEGVFAITKNFVKRQRLMAIIEKRRVKLEKLIAESFGRVDK